MAVHGDKGCDRTRLREERAGRSLTFSVTCSLVTSLTSSQEIIKNYTFFESWPNPAFFLEGSNFLELKKLNRLIKCCLIVMKKLLEVAHCMAISPVQKITIFNE